MQPAGRAPLIQAVDLWVRTPGFALSSLSFEVPRGVVLGVIGGPGSGKSLLTEVLAGLRSHDDGSLSVLGVDPRLKNLHVKSRVGLATGDVSVWSRLTPRELLQHFARINLVPAAAAQRRHDALLEAVGLTEHADTPIGLLPTDVGVRVDVARALMHDPVLLLLDIPHPSPDPFPVQTLLRRLIRENHSVLTTARNHQSIADVADEVLGLQSGRLMDQSALAAATGRPHRWRITTPDPPRVLDRLPAATAADVVGAADVVIDLRDGQDPTAVLRRLLREGVPIDSFEPAGPAAEQRLLAHRERTADRDGS